MTTPHNTTPAIGGNQAQKRGLLWFRNDLRLHDNEAVYEAAKRVKSGSLTEVLPVYVFDPRFFANSRFGTPKTGNHRAQFLLESVLDLQKQLQGIGSDLLITAGPPEDVLSSLLTDTTKPVVFAQAEVTSEETEVEAAVKQKLKAMDGQLCLNWGSTMFHKDDIPFDTSLGDLPDVFTPFKQKCEDRATVRKCFPTPSKNQLPLLTNFSSSDNPYIMSPTTATAPNIKTLTVEDISAAMPAALNLPQLSTPTPDPRGVLLFKGGESVARTRLKYYLWDTDLIADYFNTRNGMIGGGYSTKFAPWLAHGCLSPRTIYHEIKKYEETRTANKSTYWVIFELIWRDFFKFFALKHGNAIFYSSGTCTTNRPKQWSTNPELLSKWKEGRTGWPLVDANQRELVATGFMSNRGRQNVASFLTLDLGLDWRLGGDFFEHHLLDYDVASNWGNWVSAAGLTGGRVNKFNITKQSKDYDAEGEYIRRWCPELKNVPATRIHEPWLMSKEEQERYRVVIGRDYPVAIPVSQFAGRNNGGGAPSRFGNGSSSGGGGNRFSGGNNRGGGGRQQDKQKFRPKSAFDMYG